MIIGIPLDAIALLSPEKQGYLHPKENKALLPVAVVCFLLWCLWEYAFHSILYVPLALLLAAAVVAACYGIYFVCRKFLFAAPETASPEPSSSGETA